MPIQTDVGAAVAEALTRAQHHRQRSPRKVRVRLLTQWGEGEGLTVQARIAAAGAAEPGRRRARLGGLRGPRRGGL